MKNFGFLMLYQDDTLYSLHTMVDYIHPITKERFVLKASEPLVEGMCLGCFFHDLMKNECRKPHCRCTTPDGKYQYIMMWVDAPMKIQVIKDKDKNALLESDKRKIITLDKDLQNPSID